jgi:hypothetical protein
MTTSPISISTIELQLDIPRNPDLSDFSPEVASAYRVVCQREAWPILYNFSGESFMFNRDPRISALMTAIDNAYGNGHSGSSLGYTMRHLEYIAKNGFYAYKEKISR